MFALGTPKESQFDIGQHINKVVNVIFSVYIDMPKRPASHQSEDRSRIAFQAGLPAWWVYRTKPSDYGIDGEIEIFEQDGSSTGLLVLVQLKATTVEKIPPAVSVEVQWVKYCGTLGLPVILVLWSEKSGKLYWKWVSEVDLYYTKPNAKTVNVRFEREWTQSSSSELQRALQFQRKLESGVVERPVKVSIAGLHEEKIGQHFRRLTSHIPDLVTYVSSNSQVSCEIRKNEAVLLLQGMPGAVIHFSDVSDHANVAGSLALGLVLSFALRNIPDLATEIWGRIPEMDRHVVNQEVAARIVWLLVRSGARKELNRLIASLRSKDWFEFVMFQLHGLYHSAPEHKKDELADILAYVMQVATEQEDDAAASIAHYNLAWLGQRRNRGVARRHLSKAIRRSSFYEKKGYFWREVGGFLFNHGRYRSSAQCYDYARALGETNLDSRFADAQMHSGNYDQAIALFQGILDAKIDERVHVDHDVLGPLWAEAFIKRITLTFMQEVLGIVLQKRQVLAARAHGESGRSADDATQIQHWKKVLALDALNSIAWFNFAVSQNNLGSTRDSMLGFLAAAVVNTSDDESWMNALVHAFNAKDNKLASAILMYVSTLRGRQFVQYLRKREFAGDAESSRAFARLVADHVETIVPKQAPVEIRIHGRGDWKTVEFER